MNELTVGIKPLLEQQNYDNAVLWGNWGTWMPDVEKCLGLYILRENIARMFSRCLGSKNMNRNIESEIPIGGRGVF